MSSDGKLLAPRKKRASRPKTRTGCRTCKLRRVKCDETKPICDKCSRFGHKCAGYDDPASLQNPRRSKANARKLLPRSNGESSALSIICDSLSSGASFRDERESQYFRLFRDKLSDELSAGFELTLWGQIVLQACDNPSVRQLTVAAAALNRSLRTPSGGDQSKLHRKYALESYGNALHGMQAMLNTDQDIRVALIAALLIFVFEGMHGDSRRAVMSIQSALDLLNQRMIPESRASQETLAMQVYLRCEKGRTSIEDEVLKAFLRLDRPAIGLLGRTRGSRPANHWAMSAKWFHIPYEVPFRFENICQARYCYERIRFRVFPEDLFESKLQASDPLPEGVSAPAMLLMELFTETTDSITAPVLRHELRAWHRAFESLLEYSRTEEGAKTLIPASTLFIGATALNLPLCTIDAHVQPHPVQDSACDAARSVIKLSKAQIAHEDFSKGFVLEMGIIVPLWMVVVLCPDLKLQKDAIGVFRLMQPRVECVWDSRIVADTGDMLVQEREKNEAYMAALGGKRRNHSREAPIEEITTMQ